MCAGPSLAHAVFDRELGRVELLVAHAGQARPLE
jgi:hypothetical protein